MSEAVGKTPVSELQERCSIYGITPNYECVQMEGPDHAPTYWYSVTVEVEGMYEDESGWFCGSVFLRLFFF